MGVLTEVTVVVLVVVVVAGVHIPVISQVRESVEDTKGRRGMKTGTRDETGAETGEDNGCTRRKMAERKNRKEKRMENKHE